jgi:hypothetical protein
LYLIKVTWLSGRQGCGNASHGSSHPHQVKLPLPAHNAVRLVTLLIKSV